jgi:Rod binding domain-containing protein
MDVSTLSVPVDLIKPMAVLSGMSASGANGLASGRPVADSAARARIDATAKQFESQFLSVMMSQMFEGTEAEAPFGGGEAETTFRSFLTDAMAKSVTKHGGIGLAKDISKEMLKMQGLS